jgi:MFS family permease
MNLKETNLREYTRDLKPWLVCIAASLFFLYEFIQINIFSSINTAIMQAFKLDATHLGLLASSFSYSTVAFLLPAGQILDRFSPKKVILATLLLCIAGIVGFSQANHFWEAVFFRFLEGIGSAFCFLGCFRIAANWFRNKSLAFIAGIIGTIGMLGGIIAQMPIIFLLQIFTWRYALLIDAIIGIFIFAIIYFIVDDYPHKADYFKAAGSLQKIGYWNSLKSTYLNAQNWLCGIYTCLLNIPLVVLGAIWGSMFLEQVHHFNDIQSSKVVSMLFWGTIIGSPLVGFISDKMNSRKKPMLLGALLALIIILLVCAAPHLSYIYAVFLFFLLGFCISTLILGNPTAAESNIPALSATSASIVSFITMSGYIIFQPLFGWIMDCYGKHYSVNGLIIYSSESYKNALLIIPIAFLVAIIATFSIRDAMPVMKSKGI